MTSDVRVVSGSKDIAMLRGLVGEYIATWYLPTEKWSDEDLAVLDSVANIADPPGVGLLGFKNGDAVGCALLRSETGDTFELMKLYVRPSVRRDGVGRAIVDFALQRADAERRRVWLDVQRSRTAAIRLYESVGFERKHSADDEYYRLEWKPSRSE